MSGTSLDGLDLALCRVDGGSAHIVRATTVPYDEQWRGRLAGIENGTALDYAQTDVDLGHFFASEIKRFIAQGDDKVDLVASHGHTVFHQPQRGLTTQIGNGQAIAALTRLPVVCDFRMLDVSLGGQGAPLVPLGDELLFADYDACLNLGGIANISFRHAGQRVAFDICPCNMALNRVANMCGQSFDRDGALARGGIFNERLNKILDSIDYYGESYPKSLGKEWFISSFWPKVMLADDSPCNLLRTLCVHIVGQIARVVKNEHIDSMLVTGGGAFNDFLMQCIVDELQGVQVVVPDALTVNYKEALIFAFLGYFRYVGRNNTLASVTGAMCDSCGGSICGLLL